MRTKIIEIAKKEIGTTENPKDSNKTKYGEWFELNGVKWCGIFVSWVYWHAGFKIPNIGFSKGFAGCQNAVMYFKKKAWITKDPDPGDIVFFDWEGDGRYDHTGIFVEWVDGMRLQFKSIEGNTGLKNQSNGGQVMERTRTNKGVIFVHIIY